MGYARTVSLLILLLLYAMSQFCVCSNESGLPDFDFEDPVSNESEPPDCNFKEPVLGFSHGAHYDFYIWRDLDIEGRIQQYAAGVLELGGGWFRPHPSWNDIENTINRQGLTLEGITNEMVEEYAFHDPDIDWSESDSVVQGFTDAGISLILVVNGAYDGHLPVFITEDGEELLFSPDNAGTDYYLAAVSLHVRALVRRYRDRVRYWQIENELNVACETVLWGWRSGEGWCDSDFLTSLMSVLSDAVHTEDQSACTTHNFHTDLHWLNDVREWEPFLDVIGIDAYPNYVRGEPVFGDLVGDRVRQTIDIANGKPVIVLESGYPTAPDRKGFSEEGQAIYIDTAIRSTFENGGVGFFYFTLVTNEEGGQGIQNVEPYWGLFRRDGTKKHSWNAYISIGNEVKEKYR